MSEILLYHHVQGLTEGVRSFADELRQAGHTVHTPDLFDGRTFETLEDGMAFARETGFGALAERGVAAAEGIRPDVVYAGFSFGVMIAQRLAQTRRGARGALLMYSCLPVSEFGDAWPADVPVQVHGKEGDEFFSRGHRRRPRPRRVERPGGAVPLPGHRASVRGLVAAGVRCRRRGPADRARAGLPRPGSRRAKASDAARSAARPVSSRPSGACRSCGHGRSRAARTSTAPR